MRRIAVLTTLSGVVLLSAFLWASTASATVLCSSWEAGCSPFPIWTTIAASAQAGTKSVFHAKTASIECSGSSLEGKTTTTGSASEDVTGLFTTNFLTGCSSKVVFLKYGSFKIHSPAIGGNGKLTWENFEITTEFSGLHCIYGGPVTLDLEGGPVATLESSPNSKLTRIGGRSGASCDATLQWTASYAISLPQPLYVGGAWPIEPTAFCSSATTPCGAYGKGTTIEASLKSGTESVLHPPIGQIKCSESTIKGAVTSWAGTGKLSSFAFASCNTEVKTLKPGRFTLESPSGGNGTLVLEGFETTVEFTGFHCVWVSPISVTLKGGAMASLGSGAIVPRIGGKSGIFCGSSAVWTFDYTVTAPEPLYAG